MSISVFPGKLVFFMPDRKVTLHMEQGTVHGITVRLDGEEKHYTSDMSSLVPTDMEYSIIKAKDLSGMVGDAFMKYAAYFGHQSPNSALFYKACVPGTEFGLSLDKEEVLSIRYSFPHKSAIVHAHQKLWYINGLPHVIYTSHHNKRDQQVLYLKGPLVFEPRMPAEKSRTMSGSQEKLNATARDIFRNIGRVVALTRMTKTE